MQRYGDALANEQEILMLASDVITEAFAAESAVLRAEAALSTDASRAAPARRRGLHRGA